MIERLFPRNEGIGDRILRVALGAGMMSTVALFPGEGWPYVVAAVGAVPLITGLVGTCPIYTALGWTSRSE